YVFKSCFKGYGFGEHPPVFRTDPEYVPARGLSRFGMNFEAMVTCGHGSGFLDGGQLVERIENAFRFAVFDTHAQELASRRLLTQKLRGTVGHNPSAVDDEDTVARRFHLR